MLLLITRPRYDTPTHYLFFWSELLIKEAQKRGVDIIDLQKEKVTKNKVAGYLSKREVDLLIINGHGNQTSVCGQDNEVILSTSDQDIFKDKIIFIRACDAGTVLGPHTVAKGAKAFIGYNQPFIFPIDKQSFKTPLKDDLAQSILECSNQVGLSLIKGRNVEEAQLESLQKFKEKVIEYSNSNSIYSFLLPFLLWNMSCQILYKA
jgi:hypothetical protein